jgi:hypothetical protein
MSEETKEQKQFKVYFNGTKKEEIANSGAKFSKFVNNLIRPHSKVKNNFNIIFNLFFIDSIN